MSDMSIKQAAAEAKKFGSFVRAFEKIEQVADAVMAGENLLAEIKAATANANKELEAAKAELASAKEAVAAAKASAKDAVAKANEKANAALAEAEVRNTKAEQNIASALAAADAGIAAKNAQAAELDGKIAGRKVELDDLEKKLEKVQAQARKLLGG